MRPGEVIFGPGVITLNAGRNAVELEVRNTSDHTLFISSHFPFFEVNRRLIFDRARAFGLRLDIPAGDSIRWLPGEVRRVRLVPFAGATTVRGFNGLTDGPASAERRTGALRRARDGEYGHAG
jgi:urease subunit gamma/beta